jgi:hypothetical protein
MNRSVRDWEKTILQEGEEYGNFERRRLFDV